MNDTYVGWDGKPYPWPPPEGWYEASDGRWWAPGTGPNPSDPGAPAEQRPAEQPPPEAAAQGPSTTGTGAPFDAGRTEPHDGPPQQAPPQAETSSPTQAMQTSPPPNGGFQPPTDVYPGGVAASPPGYGNDGGSAWNQEPTGRSNKMLFIGLGVVAALALAAAAAFFLTRDDGGDDLATTGDSAAAPDDTTGDDAAAEGEDDGADEGESEGEGEATEGEDPDAAEDEGEDPDDTSDTTLAEDTSTTTDEDDTDDDTTTTAGDTSEQVQEFRDLLTDNSLTSTSLTDAEISSFASGYCQFASDAEDADAFGEIRENAIDNTESDLSPSELALVIDSAVVVFCPDEADRLGISV